MSPWAPRLRLIGKENGKIRLTVIYQQLNATTKVAAQPPPQSDEVCDSPAELVASPNFHVHPATINS